ncbi:vWA domain-containing protein, partial [Vibrio hepatarius]
MSEFTFLYPLWLLGLIPWLMLLVWLSKRQKSQTLIAPHLAKAMGLQVKRSKSALLSIIAATGAITLIALAGPSFSSQERPSFANTSARVVVMDMSMSMYATDIKPNRLTQARYKVTDLLNSWQDGTTALVAYAGDAYVVSPMTSDTRTIANLMPSLSPEIMPYPGANAVKGVELAVEVMQNTGASSGNIVLVTDDIDAKEKQDIESLLSGSNWRLTILGLGSRAGAPIQLQDGTLMTMDNGQPVVAKSDFAAMQSLASAVNGQFIPVQLTNRDVEQIVNLTSQVDGTSLNNKQHKIEERINQGFWLLPLLLIPALLIFRKGVFFSALLLILPLTKPTPAQASPWLTQNQQAMQQYNAGEYEQAAEQFNDPRWKGIAQYQAGDYQAAIDSLQSDTSLEGKYNLANAFAQAQDFDKAIELYQQVLEQNPQHQDAKANLEVVKQAQQQQQQQ